MSDMSFPIPDLSGPQQTTVWISVEEAAALFAEAKIPRNSRTVRRYCMRGDLECQKSENALHQPQYFISKVSVETYIQQQRTLLAGRPDRPGQDQTEPDISGQKSGSASPGKLPPLSADTCGYVQADPDRPGRVRIDPERSSQRPGENEMVVEQLEARIKDKDAEITFLRSELLHRRTTDSALHDVIAAFRANAEAQRLGAAPQPTPSAQQFDHPQGEGTIDEERLAA
jgi:hypothetical protein